MKKIKMVLPLLAVALVSMGTMVSLAMLTAGSSGIWNTFTVGKVSTSIEEEVDVVDGELMKIVRVKNQLDPEKHTTKAYIRVRLEVSPEGWATVDTPGQDTDSRWLYCEDDGFWYYLSSLAPGEVTSELMTKVMINDEAEAKEGDVLDVLVYEESCAVDGRDFDEKTNRLEQLAAIRETFIHAVQR